MDTLRKPYQGIWNIIRFNWHFYVLSIGLSILLVFLTTFQTVIPVKFIGLLGFIIFTVTLISLLVSLYIYDLSGLYSLRWVDKLALDNTNEIVNVNAGFDETSVLLEKKFPGAKLSVLDFYNPEKHTEISIKRARKAYPPFPGTLSIATNNIPLKSNSADAVFVVLSAHEIREENERIVFFQELKRVLKANGKVIVTEHLRDIPNFLAYTIGFFHFHSEKTWSKTFEGANLRVLQKAKITPFLTTYVLQNA